MVYFVTEKYLKLETPVTANIDATDVMPFIRTVADMWIRNTMGTIFYRYMLDIYNQYKVAQSLAVDPNTVDINTYMNTAEQNLLMEIRPAIAWRAASNAVIELTVQLKNKGLQMQSGDNSQAVDFKMMAFIAQHYDDMGRFYENRLFEYLKDNREDWPQFMDVNNRDSDARKSCFGSNDIFNPNVFSI